MTEHAHEDREHINEVLDEVVSDVGMRFGVSIAQRARLCAERLWETGDEAAIVTMLAEGWERELSRQFSRARSSVKEAVTLAALDGGDVSRQPLFAQLAFPIVAPGQQPVLLANATHQLIDWAYEAEARQLEGRQRNVAKLKRFRDATAAWPDEKVSDLLASGRLSLDGLFGEETG